MKKLRISRLFHWLYASLMLAPLLAIGVSCLTHVFNKEVEMPTQLVEFNYKYDSKVPVSENDIGNTDMCYMLIQDLSSEDSYEGYYFSYIALYKEGNILMSMYNYEIYPQIYNNKVIIDYQTYTDYDTIIYSFNLSEDFDYIYETNLLSVSYECPIEYLPIESVIVTENELPNTNIFYYSVDKAMNSQYFSWAKDSFLVEPFKFIGELFNVPIDNPIYLLLSYWLDISLIWLVFDLIMYVPMLVHSWIDKSVIGG